MTKEWINQLKPIAKHYKVRIYFSKTLPNWVDGYSHGKNGITININKEKTQNQLFSTFFHELGHVYCKRNGIWKSYHNPKSSTINKVRRTALKAELWVDKWAINKMKEHFPDNEYVGSYINMNRHLCKKIFYKNWLNKFYKNEKKIN